MKWDLASYRENIPHLAYYLSTLLAGTGREEARVATARYLEGLLLPGRRKFIRPLAERLQVDSQSLHQAIANSPWNDQEVWTRIRKDIIPRLEPFDRWIIHEQAWAKQGAASVGVANQQCGANGKKSRCQVSIELLASNGAYAAPLAGRLYVPKDWSADAARVARHGVPADANYTTRAALALALLRETERDGLAPKIVMADSSYGNDHDFRSALCQNGIEFLLEIDGSATMAWDFQCDAPGWDSSLQPHPYALNKILQKIAAGEWKSCSWISGDGTSHQTRLAMREVFVDSGSLQVNASLQRLWLVVDWPASEPKPFRCYLGHFLRPPSVITCLQLSRSRSYATAYQKCVEHDLDLICYQGRSWRGFHHHLVLAAAAYLFVLSAELRRSRSFWCELGSNQQEGIDPAIAAEIMRLTSILLRSGHSGLETPNSRLTPAIGMQPGPTLVSWRT
jgi:SRSO17 transposase